MYKAFLIKYGEIGLKGKNRHIFEEALADQITRALNKVYGEYKVFRENGRIFAEVSDETLSSPEYDKDKVIEALKTVFGIVWICPVLQFESNSIDEIAEQVNNHIDEEYKEKDFTFKVEARRARKNFELNSMEINAEIGGRILDRFDTLKVDVHKPDVTVYIEIRNKVNVYSVEIPGLGGLPLGSSGKAMLLLSGGIDSPVAGYMIAKRGVSLSATYFHAPPYTSERAKQKVVDLATIISKYTGPVTLNIVNFTDIQLEIYKNCPADEMTIIMRRYMMRIAERLGEEQGCLGLVTGESIGQVASQTMHGLYCTNAICKMPVYRPLIAFDKQDIIDVAERIGTYETSIEPYEDCCTIFVAKHPVTKPKLNVIENDEHKLDGIIENLIEEAINTTETLICE